VVTPPFRVAGCGRREAIVERRHLEVKCLGVVPYLDARTLQHELVEDRRQGRIPDSLLLLQHPPVITVGVRGDGGRSHILASPERLAWSGIEVHESGRGGDVTYHGPGQIVGYPILDLRPDRCDVHRYVRDIEEVLIRVCADFGVEAGRIKGLTGVWTEAGKIGAIGIRVSRWITSHGFAFNVNTNLEHFGLIVPCGIADRSVTSLARETGGPVPMSDAERIVARRFCEVFDAQPWPGDIASSGTAGRRRVPASS
jgi:lipoyl(octanoyl) transferase